MTITEEMLDHVGRFLFELYGKDRELQAHRRRHWGQLSEMEYEDWRFDARRVLEAVEAEEPDS